MTNPRWWTLAGWGKDSTFTNFFVEKVKKD